jgi:deoxyribonuclease-4
MVLRVGAHLSKGKNLGDAINSIIDARGNALQFFLSAPVNSSPGTKIKPSEITTIEALNGCIYLIVHGKYILNFCRPRESSSEWQFKSIKNDMIEADKIGADVIIHQGKNVKTLKQTHETAMKTFCRNIESILEETPELKNKIVLENSCQQGTEMGFTVEQLAEIYHEIDSKYHPRIGFCLDLCHIFVSGACDVRCPDAVDEFFDQFNNKIGVDKLTVIHFNDSKTQFGKCNDHHDDLGVGHIGNTEHGGSIDGFKRVVYHANIHDIPMILETPRKSDEHSTEKQIELIRSWE